MADKNENFVEEMAKIGAEEAQFYMGIMKFIFPMIAIGVLIGAIVNFGSVDLDNLNSMNSRSGLFGGAIMLLIAVGFFTGSWRTHKIHTRVKKLNNK